MFRGRPRDALPYVDRAGIVAERLDHWLLEKIDVGKAIADVYEACGEVARAEDCDRLMGECVASEPSTIRRKAQRLVREGKREEAVDMLLPYLKAYVESTTSGRAFQLLQGREDREQQFGVLRLLKDILVQGGMSDREEVAMVDDVINKIKAGDEDLRAKAIQEVRAAVREGRKWEKKGKKGKKKEKQEKGSGGEALRTGMESMSLEDQKEEVVDDCPMCLCELDGEEGEEEEVVGCRHRFHSACLDAWASKCEEKKLPATCPTCRGTWPGVLLANRL